MSNIELIQSLINEKAEAEARLNLIPYDGSPEVKENKSGKYLYIRKRVGSRLTSTYVDVYSDELYQLLLSNAREVRELKNTIRKISKRLAELGYTSNELPAAILLNLDFARANMKSSIYDQAVLEGVSTTFPQTEDIIENGTVNGMTATDVQKVLNLKHAWEFILDEDVMQAESDYYLLCHIAKLINEGFSYPAQYVMSGQMIKHSPVVSYYDPKAITVLLAWLIKIAITAFNAVVCVAALKLKNRDS